MGKHEHTIIDGSPRLRNPAPHPPVVRATRACIHLGALRANVQTVRSALPRGTLICAAVKANGYGHGVLPVSQTLREEGVEVLGVSSAFEGRELRDGGDRGRILLFGPVVGDEIPLALESNLEIMVTDTDYLALLEENLQQNTGEVAAVHLKIDTGMGRVGCAPDQAVSIARRIHSHPRMRLAGTATHFPSADSTDPDDLQFTHGQIDLFKSVTSDIRGAGIDPGVIHAANSGGIALSPESTLAMVRPGIFLYGYGPGLPNSPPLIPVMEFRTRITALKKVSAGTSVSYGRTWKAPCDTWIATIPVGYADGYSRLLSNRADVLVAGCRRPIAGTICMDQSMVDLGPETSVRPGDEVVLFGPDPAGPDAAELAGLIGTISYEITCGISPRVPRVYLD